MSTLRQAAVTPASEALHALLDGNMRFVSGAVEHPHQALEWRENLTDGQSPMAAILSCSDSRVPPELVFDTGFGDLFVIRTAGHIIDESVMVSLEFAISVLEVPLVVVVGHENCGAVNQTIEKLRESDAPSSFISTNFLINQIAPAAREAFDHGNFDTADVERSHLKASSVRLASKCAPLRNQLVDQTIGLATMRYELRTGTVELLSAVLP